MRKPRELISNARYHVGARANRKEMILESAEIKTLFLEVIAKAKKRYDFKIENFCVMGNHFHLIIMPGKGECLSRIMQWALSVFAQKYNRLHNLTGHVWGERFFSRVIRSVREYLKVCEYIDDNPVKASLVRIRTDWCFGGLSFRRRAHRGILDDIPPHISWLLPAHFQLMLAPVSDTE